MDYGNLKVPENVTPEVQAILDSYEARNKEIEKNHKKEMAKLYGGAALQLGSAFIPGTLGLKAAGGAIKALTPYVGKKIAENVATGVTSGLASGAVEGLGRGLIEGENPLKTMVSDATLGTLFGGAFGLAGGKIGKTLAEKNLQNGNIAPQKYFDDYVVGLKNPNRKDLQDYRSFNLNGELSNGNTQISYDTPDDFVENMKNFDISNYSKDEYKQLRKQAKAFYKNNLSPKTASVGDVNVLFTDLGLDEQLSKGLHNVDVFTDLINQIETGNLHPELVNNRPNDKRLFHIVNNKFKDKDMEYQLLNDKNADKFYFAKDITNKKELPQIGRNQNTTYEEVPTNSITDYDKNLKSFMENADYRFLDNKGEPLRFFHGTPNAGFNEFRENSFFTPDKTYAEVYKNQAASSLGYKKTADNPDVYEVFINSKKPFDTRDEAAKKIFQNEYQAYYSPELTDKGMVDWMEVEELKPWLQENYPEYDSIIADEGGVGGYGEAVKSRGFSFIPFEPTQIKSVNNQGTFDPTNPNIYKSLLPVVGGGLFELLKNNEAKTNL